MKYATIALFLLATLLGAGLPVAAQGAGSFETPEKPEANEKPSADEKSGADEKPGAVAKDAPSTPIQKLLKELEALVAREKARPKYDMTMVRDIEKLIALFRRAEKDAKPVVKLDDLSDEDRERLKEEARKELAEERRGEGGAEGGGGGDWAARDRARRVERCLEGITLKDDQREKVEEMLGEYNDDSRDAYRNRDYGLVNDLKKDLEKRLKRVVGSKKARDIINNVNRNLTGRRGW